MKNIGISALCVLAAIAIACNSRKEVMGLYVSPESATLEVGQTMNLKVVSQPDGSAVDVEWYSMKPSVAIVENGKVQAVSVGHVNLVATAFGFRSGCVLSVVPATVHVTGIKLDLDTMTVEIGKKGKLVAIVSPADASNPTVFWTSSDTDVVTVEDGEVTTCHLGEADIIATTMDGNYSDTCRVIVKSPDIRVTGVTLDKNSVSIWTGEMVKLSPTVLPSNATNQSVTWSSSNESIATVSSTGLVFGNGVGECDITVKTVDGSFTASCHCNVKKGSTSVEGVSLSEKSLKMYIGATGTLTASIYPSTALNKNVSWSSSSPAIVSVDDKGKVRALANGETVITVTTEEGGYTDTCTILVESYGSGSEGFHFGGFTWD